MWKSMQLKTFWYFLDKNIWSRLRWKSEICAHKIQITLTITICALYLTDVHQKNRRDFQ